VKQLIEKHEATHTQPYPLSGGGGGGEISGEIVPEWCRKRRRNIYLYGNGCLRLFSILVLVLVLTKPLSVGETETD
jgi:hypothetical protein